MTSSVLRCPAYAQKLTASAGCCEYAAAGHEHSLAFPSCPSSPTPFLFGGSACSGTAGETKGKVFQKFSKIAADGKTLHLEPAETLT